MKEEMVTITKKEYEELKDSEFLLDCLNNNGIDGWEWYGDALEEYWNGKED